MNQLEKRKKQAIKEAASLGINLKTGKKPSGKVLFPEKLELANRVATNMKFPPGK